VIQLVAHVHLRENLMMRYPPWPWHDGLWARRRRELMAKRGRKVGWRSKPERNAKIVKRYERGATAAELAELFGLSKERICQICREAGVIRKRGRPW
jgi:hypothetical protein